MGDSAYATWDRAIADGHITDEPDGWPDTMMVPLVVALREQGLVTLQSCQGHEGSDDGHLWVRGFTGTWDTMVLQARLRGFAAEIGVFTKIAHVYDPQGDWWEFWWLPRHQGEAIDILHRLLTRRDHG